MFKFANKAKACDTNKTRAHSRRAVSKAVAVVGTTPAGQPPSSGQPLCLLRRQGLVPRLPRCFPCISETISEDAPSVRAIDVEEAHNRGLIASCPASRFRCRKGMKNEPSATPIRIVFRPKEGRCRRQGATKAVICTGVSGSGVKQASCDM